MTLRFLGRITYRRCNFVYKYNGTYACLDNTDFNEIFSNGHTARGILVYVLRNLLNRKRVLEESFEVDIKENSLFLSKGYWNEELYSFHAFNLGLRDKLLLTDKEIIE